LQAGNNAVLEVFLSDVKADTLVTMETSASGFNSVDTQLGITLTV